METQCNSERPFFFSFLSFFKLCCCGDAPMRAFLLYMPLSLFAISNVLTACRYVMMPYTSKAHEN